MDRHRDNDGSPNGQRRFLARFSRDREGSTVTEFALLAVPFVLLVFAILESCISFAAQEVMANATDTVARQLRTGQIKPEDVTTDSLKALVCEELQVIVAQGCPGLEVDLRAFPTFADAAKAGFTIAGGDIVLTDNGAEDAKQFVAEPGPAQSRNMLRVFYKWPVITDFMARSMANLNDGATLHYASTIWQSEPYN